MNKKNATRKSGSFNSSDSKCSRSKTGTVSSLKPNQAVIIVESAKISQAAQLMAAKRTDAVLVVNDEGSLVGILTDKDIAYRVVAEGLDIRTTTVNAVMTPEPISVLDRGSRNEALNIMVSKRFRHLPVISDKNLNEDEEDDEFNATSVVGLLDITKCVFERLEDLERKTMEDMNIMSAMEVLERRGAVASEHVGALRLQHGCPDIGYVISQIEAGRQPMESHSIVPEVSIKANVRDAAKAMKASHGTAVLVMSANEGEVSGIFTTKDIVLRVIAASLDPSNTSVVRVMTPHPDSVNQQTTILEALKKLRDGHYLHLPVVDESSPVGLVDVMTLTICMLTYLMTRDASSLAKDPTANDDGPLWNKFWNSTFANAQQDIDNDESSQASDGKMISTASLVTPARAKRQSVDRLSTSYALQSDDVSPTRLSTAAKQEADFYFAFKLKDMTRGNEGKTFRFSCDYSSLTELYSVVCQKTGATCGLLDATQEDDQSSNHGTVTREFKPELLDFKTTSGVVARLCYMDDESDIVQIQGDKDLEEAVRLSKRNGWRRLLVFLGEPQVILNEPEVLTRQRSPASSKSSTPQQRISASALNQLFHPHSSKSESHSSVSKLLSDPTVTMNLAISSGIVIVAAFIISRLFHD